MMKPIFIAALATIVGATQPTGEFLWLTDFHYDAFYDGTLGSSCFCNNNKFYEGSSGNTHLNTSAAQCAADTTVNAFGKVGCDSSLQLIESSIAAAAKALPDPAFILITGDYTRHDTNKFGDHATVVVQEAIGKITALISAYFPTTTAVHLPSEQFEFNISAAPVIGSFGNNDFPLNYGGIEVTNGSAPNAYFKLTQSTVAGSGSRSNFNSDSESNDNDNENHSDSFELGGYTLTSVSPTLSVINLNTIPYSPSFSNPSPDTTDTTATLDPYNQFQWLETTLAKLEKEGKSTYVTGHIPPALDTFADKPQWKVEYIEKYESIIRRYAGVVKAQLFGHTHKDEWRVHPAGTGTESSTESGSGSEMPPFLLSGAITPIYRNNPSFRTVSFDKKKGELQSWKIYSANLAAADANANANANANAKLDWVEEYNSMEEYGLTGPITNAKLTQLTQKFFTDEELFTKFWLNSQARWPTAEQYSCGKYLPATSARFQQCRVGFVCSLQTFNPATHSSCVERHAPLKRRLRGSRVPIRTM